MSRVPRALAASALACLGTVLSIRADAPVATPPTTRQASNPAAQRPRNRPLNVTATTIRGQEQDLWDYRGQVVLIVNVASQWGFTPQYAGLERLYQKYHDRGLVILGFPSNDFGRQEPGTNEQIQQFVDKRFHVTFPMFAKISVKGADKHPLYKVLTQPANGGEVAWNFTKVLIGRDGRIAGRFPSTVTPEDAAMVGAIEASLAQAAPPEQSTTAAPTSPPPTNAPAQPTPAPHDHAAH
jgi:glutathione peroxidase